MCRCVCNGWDVESSASGTGVEADILEVLASAPEVHGPGAAKAAVAAGELGAGSVGRSAPAASWDVSDSESAASASAESGGSWPPICEAPPVGPDSARHTEFASRLPDDVPEAFWLTIVWTFMLQFRIARWGVCEGLPGINRDLLCAGTCPEIFACLAILDNVDV